MKTSRSYTSRTNIVILIALVVSVVINLLSFVRMNSITELQVYTEEMGKTLSEDVLSESEYLVLLKNGDTFSDNTNTYIATVSSDGDIKNIYNLNDSYDALAYDLDSKTVYIISETRLLSISASEGIEESNVSIDSNKKLYSYSLSIEGNIIKISSKYDVANDNRLDFDTDYGYHGVIKMKYSNLIPISVVVVH